MNLLNTLYTIAVEQSRCYGHGDYGTETNIVRDGAYGMGEYPPIFEEKKEAEEYRLTKYGNDTRYKVVTLIFKPKQK